MKKIACCIFVICSLAVNYTIAKDFAERQLTEKVVERTYSDGKRSIIVDGKELEDLTPKPEAALGEIDKFDAERGFIVYSRAESDQVFRFSVPKPEERIDMLSVSLCPDEKRHRQFTIYALNDIGEATVSVGALRGSKGGSLRKEAISIRPVRLGLWRDYWNSWFKEAPKLIDAEDGKAAVSKGQNQQYWISVRIPSSAQADTYTGEINIKTEKGGTKNIKFTVEILPFQLAEGMWWGVYYYSGFNETTPRDFADMKAHGVNSMLLCPPGHVEPVFERDGNSVKISFPQTDLAMAELKKQGFNRPVAYYPRFLSSRILQMFARIDGDKLKAYDYYGQLAVDFKAKDYPEDLKLVLKDVFRQMVLHAKEANWPEILWYFDDEPGAADSPGHMIPLQWSLLEYGLFKEIFPHEKTLCTIYNLDTYKQLPVDICVGELWRLNDEFINYVRSNDGEVWGIRWLCQYNTYTFPRQFAGIGLEKRGIHGFTEWTYYGAPLYKPYNQLIDKEGCHYAFVDQQGRLLTTITWEGVQEGINDARYIATLRKLIDKARSSGNKQDQKLASEVEEVLNKVMNKVPDSRVDRSALKEAELDQLRDSLARAINRLISAGIRIG
jgi:hypothetical protein